MSNAPQESEWLKIMLEEIHRKRIEAEAATAERHRRSQEEQDSDGQAPASTPAKASR